MEAKHFDLPDNVQVNFGDGPVTKLKNCGYKARQYFREYCNNTSIHGFKYLGEKRTRAEKAWWLLCILVCMITCSIMTSHMFRKWQVSPVFVSFATKGTPIYEIPFPAVTICPQARFAAQLLNYTDLFHKKLENVTLSAEDEENFGMVSLICHTYSKLQHREDEFVENPEKFYKLLKELAPDILNWSKCEWMGHEFKCSEILVPVVTDDGLCYTFNMLDRKDLFREDIVLYEDYLEVGTSSTDEWSMENGFKNKEDIDTYPRRAILSGAKYAFHMEIVTMKSDLDYICTSSIQGFKVILHTPGRLPLTATDYFSVPLNQAVIVSVQPDMMTTSEPVKAYPSYKRECYFSSERYLRYFRVYTQNNCQLECLTNYTLRYCDCVNFFMPHDNETYLCGVDSKNCMLEAERKLTMRSLAKSFNATYQKLKRKSKKVRKSYDCDCLPLCTELSYNIELSQNDWKWYEKYKAVRSNDHQYLQENQFMSKLIIYFKNDQFITSQRNELYGWKEFLANFGGFLGLFSGFSLLSLVEIFYFATVRVAFNIRLYGRKNWAGPNNS